MKKKIKKMNLSKETLRNLSKFELRVPAGGKTEVAACVSAEMPVGTCGTWGESDCGDCTSVNRTNCGCTAEV